MPENNYPAFAKELINELLSIEAQALDTQLRCCKARQSLERFYGPATRKGLSPEFEKSMNSTLLKRRKVNMKR